jgi:osmotically-inducible protein OsmY
VKKPAVAVCLSIVLACACAEALRAAGAQAAQKESTSARTADRALQARVQSALSSAADLQGHEIVAEVRGGVLSLTGEVATPSELQTVGAVARAVPGVKTIRFAVRVVEPPPTPVGRGPEPGGRGSGPSGSSPPPAGRGAAPNQQR